MSKKAAARQPLVAIIMGSDSDWPILKGAKECLDDLQVECLVEVVSAHRTPEKMVRFAKSAEKKGIRVIIAGAGGAAHLPGMVASLTDLPVIGIPVHITKLEGLDALFSIVQMPRGVPVATVAIDGAYNAGLLAAKILAAGDEPLRATLKPHFQRLRKAGVAKVKKANRRLA